jgi:hypothetical protein
MTTSDRRRFLKGLLGALAGTAGTVVLGTTSTPAATAAEGAPEGATEGTAAGPHQTQPSDIQERAEQIATTAEAEQQDVPVSAFVNGGGGGFRNSAFRNGGGGGGGFRNGGFANGGGGGGGFRKGGFANGVGGGFRNGGFRNW